MDRLPSKEEIFNFLVTGFAIAGKDLTIEQQIELRQIVEEESEAILAWGLASVAPERRAEYLHRCGVAARAAGARFSGRN